jgi:hypothetical protein
LAVKVFQEWVKAVKVTKVVAVMVVQEWAAWVRLQRFLQQQDHPHK